LGGAGLGAVAGGTLGGLANRPSGNRPNWGDRNLAGNLNDLRQNNLGDIRNNFNNRNDWNNNRGDWNNWRDNHPNWREDWQNWHQDWHHGDWYHGCWHGNYNSYWNHMWNEHPVAAAFGLTAWGVNRMSYWFGYAPYYNPYWVEPVATTAYYDYSQPIVVTQPVTQETVVSTDSGQALPPDVTPQSMSTFDQARKAFLQGSYNDALKLSDQALQEAPRDAVLHEFRALVLFAIGKYKEAASTLHAVLAVGPGWDWTTLIGLYGNSSSTYTQQLRALEAFTKSNPKRADARFVLGYHYLTAGHAEAAAKQFQLVTELEPKDTLAVQLSEMLTGKPSGGEEAPPPADSAEKPSIPESALQGKWTAQGTGGSTFSLSLNDKDEFVWSYTHGGKTETVSGVYGIDGDTLALEPDGGGAMLAQVSEPKENQFHFQMIGAPKGDPGLDFKK
jgi:tetratricopeptide (TPR) repeat protein